MRRRDWLDQFYGLLAELELHSGGRLRLADCDGKTGWPVRGVYFFFEGAETRSDGSTPRVVRVGTHALRPAASTLWGRLSQHKGTVNGSFAGGGNHRGSIFRLHVGTALLATGDWPAEVRATWGVGSTASAEVRRAELPLERAVSQYIRAMPFLVVEIDDPPGAGSDRGVVEAGSISLLSNLDRPAIDPPSRAWLGLHADRTAVRESGLWNVSHVGDPPGRGFLDTFTAYVRLSA